MQWKSVGHGHSKGGQVRGCTWEEGCGGGACEYCMCCRASGGPGNWGGGGGACMGHYASNEDSHKAFKLMPLQYPHVTLERS